MNPEDVVGLDTIAERTRRGKSTVRQWRDRFDDFPEPRHLGTATGQGSAPWWNWADVERWLDAHPKLGNRQ